MTITLSEVKTIPSFNASYVDAELVYPKLILFQNKKNIVVVDLVNNNQDETSEEEIHTFEEEISDKKLVLHFLWLVFESGKIMVIDVFKNTQVIIVNENSISLKLRQIGMYQNRLCFLSESGDSFEISYDIKNVIEQLEKCNVEVHLPFKKTTILSTIFKTTFYSLNGMNLYKESGTIMMECPITGLLEAMCSKMELCNIAIWSDLVVFANDSKMWIVNLQDDQIIFEFENIEGNYYPVQACDDVFYYLQWNSEKVHVCCAIFAQSSSKKLPGNSEEYLHTTSIETYKTQLTALIESISVDTTPADVLPQLQSLFEQIDDFAFLVETLQKLCQLHISCKSILYLLQKRILATNNSNLNNMVSDLSIKIDLVEYIQFTGNHSYENIDLFEQNLISLCVIFLNKHDFDIASICWLKYSQLKLTISSDEILIILNSISNNAKIASIIIWLKNFIPPLLEINPFYIDTFVRWATVRVFMLEQSTYWPKIGVKFVEEVILILETSFKSIWVRPLSMDDLDLLKTRITHIIELKEKYKINMLLSELSSQSPNEIALIMIRRCYTEDLSIFLQNYLPSYVLQHLFDMDEILSSYIESEAVSSGGGIDGSRLKILLEAFHSYNNKLECLLQVLKVLDVPWNISVIDLAISTVANTTKNFTASDTERLLSLEIQKEINYANVKVILKKYNFPMSCTDYMLVLHKVVCVPAIEIDDLNVITSVMPMYKHYGNILYIERCLQDCETRLALKYFNNIPTKEKKLLLKAVVAKYDQIISRGKNELTVEKNYLDFIKGTKLLNVIEMNNLETLYHFKYSYSVLLNMNDIYNEGSCENTVSSWINQDGESASSGRGGSVAQLTQACQSQQSVLMALLRRTSTCHQVRKLVEYLIRLFSIKDVSVDDFMKILSQFQYGENSSLLLKSYNVLIDLAIVCSEQYLHNLINQISLLNTLIHTNIVVKNLSIAWKFQYIFLPISSSTAMNDLINFYRTKLYPEHCVTDPPNIYSKCDFTLLRLISNTLVDEKVNKTGYFDDEVEITKRLLSKVVTSQDLDEILITSLLLIIRTYDENISGVIEVLKGQNEFLPHHILCYLTLPSIRRTFLFDHDLFTKDVCNSVSYPPQHILKSKFNINLADIALPESSEETWDVKVILFYVLLQYPDTSFERLVELCRALNISTNDGLSLQLIALLSTWELKYNIYVDNLSQRQILIESNETRLNRCIIIWESIDNKDLLKDILNDFWRNGEITLHGRVVSINPYYYEVFLCIYRLIFGYTCEMKNTKEYFLLHFLKEYKRTSSPKQYEYELFSIKGMFPEIGHFRLPFHLFMREDMWANLKSEITLETYERWLPSVALLSLDSDMQTARDMICSNAVKQTMTMRKRIEDMDSDTKHEPWGLTSREEPLLRAAHRCVKHIANMEWAGACLFYVLQGCARGADQVAAAHLCYQFAQRWASLQPGNRAVRQMERLHSTLSTRHALYKIDWACEEFVRLSTEPAQLIRTLYFHSDFVSKMNRHDVNRAINEIADKNGINVSSIRIQILENILEKSYADNKDIIALTVKELMTAKYILKATCPKMGAIYLSRIAFDDESENNKYKKLRALQCLISIVDSDTAIKVTSKERDALWISLIELFSVVNLECVDMPWIAATFTHDKSRGLEQLLQNVEGNTAGLKIAAQLAARFGSTQIIRSLIPFLLRAGLFEEIIPLLLKLSGQIDSAICSAWRAVILSPFQRADYPITERQRSKCLNTINLLPVCPLIKDEDLVEIWKNCLRCKCFGLGCLVLPYMSSQCRQGLTELQKVDRRNLIASLKNLNSETYLVSGAMHVIERMASRAYR
ncbi:unnamed protein product [Arctia plantaginis]|uniref:Kinetochore-associated protein 1 n=1 Tax=Arctia plantaginis TaxID=874455 RepID=A0A8S1A5Q3_ARCPL|nr:unnamed protein product [Arctia plantaginis]